jgi:heme-degrading monooxygenase HmoA
MLLRLVHLTLNTDRAEEVARVYGEKVLPVLHAAPGCLFATLIRSARNPNDAISMTLWDNLEHADAYEASGLFRRLLDTIAPNLAEASEWKVQLSKDLTLEYAPVQEEPTVRSYTVATSTETRPPTEAASSTSYVRILSVRLQPGKREEFERLYDTHILSTLRDVPGCRYAFLTEGLEDPNEVLSVTIWDSREAAQAYEASGVFRSLTRKVEHTFSELYQWKLFIEERPGGQATSTADLRVTGYDVVSGSSFGRKS